MRSSSALLDLPGNTDGAHNLVVAHVIGQAFVLHVANVRHRGNLDDNPEGQIGVQLY